MSSNGHNRLRFRYEKGPDCRIIYANGAFGGPTPKGEIKFDLFTEVIMPPDSVVHAVQPDGKLGDELERQPAEPEIVRQIQVAVIMSLPEAKNFSLWLSKHIATLEQRSK